MARHILGIGQHTADTQLRWLDYASTSDYKSLVAEVATASGNAVWPESLWTNLEDPATTPET